eukprot:TRINITY_DN5257_c2_g2_i1.p1 TRINITY_DN5257_c2_g2~~TRINITY_DN5257_c2_g2_i1.p1  ORF type:complete len:408 (-),score=72.87 TRINITY_DN5257_c2_g2_i1:42-1265(-)
MPGQRPCTHWANFKCNYGDACSFSHEGPGGPAPGGAPTGAPGVATVQQPQNVNLTTMPEVDVQTLMKQLGMDGTAAGVSDRGGNPNGPPCKHWAIGKCNVAVCNFSHEGPGSKSPLGVFKQVGSGAGANGKPPAGACNEYTNSGFCRFGDVCKFLHRRGAGDAAVAADPSAAAAYSGTYDYNSYAIQPQYAATGWDASQTSWNAYQTTGYGTSQTAGYGTSPTGAWGSSQVGGAAASTQAALPADTDALERALERELFPHLAAHQATAQAAQQVAQQVTAQAAQQVAQQAVQQAPQPMTVALAPAPVPVAAVAAQTGMAGMGVVVPRRPGYEPAVNPDGTFNMSAAPPPPQPTKRETGVAGLTPGSPCRYFALGKCNFPDCKFSHEGAGGVSPLGPYQHARQRDNPY